MLDGVMLLWFLLTALSLLFVVVDIRATPESPILKWGFILLTAYTGPLGAFLYVLGRQDGLPRSRHWLEKETLNHEDRNLSPELLHKMDACWRAANYLSGGQSAELASARLNAMNVRFKSRLPWALAYSFARAIQQPALEIWQGEEAHVLAAQQAFYHRAMCNRAARCGEYNAAIETT